MKATLKYTFVMLTSLFVLFACSSTPIQSPTPDINQIVTATFQAMTQEAQQTEAVAPTKALTHTLSPTMTEVPSIQYEHPDGYYSVTIPPGWVYKEFTWANSACTTELILSEPNIGFPDKYQGIIVIDVCQVSKIYYPNSSFQNISGDDVREIELDNRSGFEKVGLATAFKLGSTFDIQRLVFYENDKVYSIDYRHIPEMPDYESAFNKLLQSFKFHVIQNTVPPTPEATATPVPQIVDVLPKSLYYSAKDADGKYQIYRLGRDGVTVTQITFEQNDPKHPDTSPQDLWSFGISPNDGTITFSIGNQIIAVDSNGENRQVLVEDPNSEFLGRPVWSPDGQIFAYCSNAGINIYSLGNGQSSPLITNNDTWKYCPSNFSPDGKKLIIAHETGGGSIPYIYDLNAQTQIPLLPAEGGNHPLLCGQITWIDSNSFFCHNHVFAGATLPGLWRIDATTGSNIGLLWSRAPYNLVTGPRQDPNGNLYFLHGEHDGSFQQGKPLPRLSLVRSESDGVSNRVTLRSETFLVQDASWTPDNKALIILQEDEKGLPSELLFVPIDPTLPVITLLPDAHNVATFRWGP